MSPTGYKYLDGTKNPLTQRVRAYRLWQIIDSDAMNIMIEPEFHFNVIDGTATITTATDSKGNDLGGNAKGNWVDVTPTGTAFVAVNYEALDVYTSADAHGTHGGFYPANDPAHQCFCGEQHGRRYRNGQYRL